MQTVTLKSSNPSVYQVHPQEKTGGAINSENMAEHFPKILSERYIGMANLRDEQMIQWRIKV